VVIWHQEAKQILARVFKGRIFQSKVEKFVRSHQRQPTKEAQGHNAEQKV